MKDRQPWSVRGVTREARAKAARAASQQHMTIGEWVTRTLIEAADRDLGLASETTPDAQAGTANLPAKAGEQQRELTRALGDLVQYLEKTAQANDVGRRLERTEHALMGRMEQMAAGLYSLMQTMETRTMPVVDVETGSTRLMLPDQSRLAAAVERMVDAEARRQDQMAAVADALTMLAGRVGDAEPPAGQGAAAEEPVPEPVPEAEVASVDVLELETEGEDDEDDILELDDEVADESIDEIPPKPMYIPAASVAEAAGEMTEGAGPAEKPVAAADALVGASKPRPIIAPSLDEADDDDGAQSASGPAEEAGAGEAAPKPKPVVAEADEEETSEDDTDEAAQAFAEDEAEDEPSDFEDETSEPEPEDEEASEVGEERISSAAATASWIASGRRDHADDVVANIRARSVNRTTDEEAGEEPGKRGLLGRLFRRS